MARERGAEAVSRLLSEVAQSDGLGTLSALAPERLATTTRFFQDLVLMPLIMRALFGEKLDALRAKIEPHVARTVAFFLAACRDGGGRADDLGMQCGSLRGLGQAASSRSTPSGER